MECGASASGRAARPRDLGDQFANGFAANGGPVEDRDQS